MGVFDDKIKIIDNGKIIRNKWIEWNHFLLPNKPEWFREILRNIFAVLKHCMNCSALDGCYFLEQKMPNLPLHNRCDCDKIEIEYKNVQAHAHAECDIRKFTEYIFTNAIDSKGKNKIFNSMGFSIESSEYLQNEFCKQALKQYLSGNYILKNLDMRGQRLAIIITLNNFRFYSGWLLCPEGKIKNTTPFGGWLKDDEI